MHDIQSPYDDFYMKTHLEDPEKDRHIFPVNSGLDAEAGKHK